VEADDRGRGATPILITTRPTTLGTRVMSSSASCATVLP
jgi:hypothetical protein